MVTKGLNIYANMIDNNKYKIKIMIFVIDTKIVNLTIYVIKVNNFKYTFFNLIFYFYFIELIKHTFDKQFYKTRFRIV